MSSGPPYYYSWTPAAPPVPRVSTSRTEILHLSIAFVVLTVDLTIIFGGGGLLTGGGAGFRSLASLSVVLIAAAAALTGFLCHELAHKIYAQRHGFWAEFRMSPFGLVFSLITAYLGFLWAAPGATVISGMSAVDRENWGRTSLAGPLSNVTFAVIFFAGAIATYRVNAWAYSALILLAWVNGWFGTFNLLPVGPLDGAKVLRWSAGTWVAAIVLIGGFTALLTLILYGVTTPFLGF
jgi:Zn-dependent protease